MESSKRNLVPKTQQDVHDTWGSFREEDEKASTQEYCNNCTTKLSDELVAWLGTKEITGLQITSHVCRLTSSTTGYNTAGQVKSLCRFDGKTSGLGNSAEDELRSLGDSRNGINVSDTSGLDADEGEDESENERENSLADIHAELSRQNRTAHDSTQTEANCPP